MLNPLSNLSILFAVLVMAVLSNLAQSGLIITGEQGASLPPQAASKSVNVRTRHFMSESQAQ